MRLGICVALFLIFNSLYAQNINFDADPSKNLYIRMYGNIDYNQSIVPGQRTYGKMDVHRIVTLFGYQFSRNTQFVSEIEVEHAKEIFIEQAWVKHKLSSKIHLKAGLLLVPMGFINEQHEPTFFYSVERPQTDRVIVPTTWRAIGAGFTGLFPSASLRYQIYAINSLLGYDGSAKFNAAKGLRSGRQKGAKTVASALPSLSGQLQYYGLDDFKLALSGFTGRTNTTLGNGTSELQIAQSTIDSTTVYLNMVTAHGTYDPGQWTFRSQYSFASLGDAAAYNSYTGSNLAEAIHGFYFVAGYDFIKDEKRKLLPFFRFEHINTQLKIDDETTLDPSNKRNIYTVGLNYSPDNGVVFKLDYQYNNPSNGRNFSNINTGVGVWF